MENIMPPSGSPEEIQAWNNMMDTMVTFIKASTHLMNTITNKAKTPGATKAGGATSNLLDIMGGCEPECEACRPKPPCGTCPSASADPPKDAEAPPSQPPSTPSSKVRIIITPPTPEKESTAPEDPEAAAADTPEAAAEENAAEEGESPPEQEGAGEAEEAPKEEVQREKSASGEASLTNAAPKSATEAVQPSGDSKKTCICAAIRAKRLEGDKKKGCGCREKGKVEDKIEEEVEEVEPEPPKEEKVCSCGPTEGNSQSMIQEMVQKLANAQQEITQLQQEMARLQRMDASRKTGPHAGPNPAALYKEIMKNNNDDLAECPAARVQPQLRQKLYQSNNTGDPSSTFGVPQAYSTSLGAGGMGGMGLSQAMLGGMGGVSSLQGMFPPPGSGFLGRSAPPQYYPGATRVPCPSYPTPGNRGALMQASNGPPAFRNYQEPPSTGAANWGNLNQSFSNMSGTFPGQFNNGQNRRRIVVCGPPPSQAQNDCDEACQKRPR